MTMTDDGGMADATGLGSPEGPAPDAALPGAIPCADAGWATRFWSIVDRDGLTGLPSDEWAALGILVERAKCADPHALIWLQFSDCGRHIRRWSNSPFEGGRKCRMSLREDAL